MSSHWMRRGLLALASASALLLAACGSGSIESQLQPTRVVVFGDGFSDVGQTGKRYTVNDDGINIWTQELAASFGHHAEPGRRGRHVLRHRQRAHQYQARRRRQQRHADRGGPDQHLPGRQYPHCQ